MGCSVQGINRGGKNPHATSRVGGQEKYVRATNV